MDTLRKRAEELLQLQNSDFIEKPDDIKKVMHELQVYQIELELQNQELQNYSEKIRSAEQKFMALFNFSPISYLLLDKKGVIEEINFQAIDLLKIKKRDIERKPFVSYIAEGKMDKFYTFLNEVLHSKEVQSSEFSLFSKKRELIYCELYAQNIKDEYIVIAIIDITYKKNNEKQLIDALKKAEESDKLKSNFLNIVSHEIRTPLNAIIGFSNLINNHDLSDQKRNEFTEKITKSSDQLLCIVEDILLVSNSGEHLIAKNKDVSINELFKNLKKQFSEKYWDNSNQFVFHFPEKEIFLNTDYSKLFNIFERLVENSIKYTTNGEIEIGCNIKDSKIIFYVKDNGTGINEDDQKKLFKPFAKIETNSKFDSGLGLGLTVVSKYCKLLNGNIWHEPNADRGSVFFVEFDYSEIIISNQNIKLPEKKQSENSKKTILIAEDEIMNFELLFEILSDFDVNILHAENGKIAVDIFQKEHVDLILMDFKMPVMDGVTATKIIRSVNTKVPIIALTAYTYSDKETVKLFNTIINKPVDISKLVDTLNDYIYE